MDPLSDVLSLLKLKSYMARGLDICDPFSYHFPASEGLKCYATLKGSCWLSLDDDSHPLRLLQGACVLLPTGRSFRLYSDPNLPALEPEVFLEGAPEGFVTKRNGGGSLLLLGVHFTFTETYAKFFLGSLPAVIHLEQESDRESLRLSLEAIMEELRESQPGNFLVAQQLAYVLLVRALRLHLQGSRSDVGWLAALGDQRLSAALTVMHDQPGHSWTLESLARRAGMSRSRFAARFKNAVGVAPMDYLTRWRMLLAGDRLQSSQEAISAIALNLGYESESAFGKAFKRVMGTSPRRHSLSLNRR